MTDRNVHLAMVLALVACNGGSADDGDASTGAAPTLTLNPSDPSTTTGSTVGTTDAPTDAGPTDTTATSDGPTSTGPTSDPSTGSTTTPDTTTGPDCDGLECQVDECGGNPAQTTIRGTVFAPEGSLPLYNVTVSVPNAPLPPVAEGVTCDTCGGALPGDPIVAALTDTKGEFVLTGVPSGPAIPLVIGVGKWRRVVTVAVDPCVENLAPPDLTRLPRNQSEGHLPRIALTTGGADPLECLIRKLGIDDAEFTNPDGPGRVNLFRGDGGTGNFNGDLNDGADFEPAQDLWDDALRLQQYDLVLMACEGGKNADQKSDQARANIVEYAGLGGRLFFSHWHNVWIDDGPDPWPSVANFVNEADLPNPVTALIDTTFPKGQALAEWMVHVGGSVVAPEMEIAAGQHTIDSVDPALATRWVYTEEPENTVQYFTFNAPLDVADDLQCGRVVDSDIHVSSGDEVDQAFPDGCTTDELTPQEKALIFMIFELSSCLIPDDMDPIPG